MYKEKDLYKLAEEYESVRAPEDLNVKAMEILGGNKKTGIFRLKKAGLAAACLIAVMTAGVNISPAFAESLKSVPIIGTAIEFITFRQYEDKSEHHEMQIDGAELRGMENQELQNNLNAKYASQAEILYDDFKERLHDGEGNFTLISGYSIKADNGVTVSIEHSLFTAQASGAQSYTYDTIDSQNECYITLPGLFKDDSYVQLISQEVKRQMQAEVDRNQGASFFTDEFAFKEIDKNHQFYINNDHKLVITFDEYAIAPGVMGALEFVIPTEVIQGALVSNAYVK